MPQFTLDVENSCGFFLNLCQVWNHIRSSTQNEQKGSSWNTFYRTSSADFNTGRAPSLGHWAPTAEVLWNALQTALFSVFSLNSAREVHTCLWKHMFFTYIQLYTATKTTIWYCYMGKCN